MHRGSLLAALAALLLAAPLAAAEESLWPQVGGDALHRGANLVERSLSACTVGALTLRWSQPIGRSPQGTPSVVGGRLYAGSANGVLWALDATSGQVLWSKGLGGRIATPVVDQGRVYALRGDDASNGLLVALAASDGQEFWRRPVNANGHQSPVVGNGLVLVSSNRLYAFSAATGQPLWSYGDESGVAYEPAVVGDLIVGADDGKLVALTADGSERWWRQTSAPALAYRLRVSADGGLVFAGGFDGMIRAVSVGEGSLRWSAVTYGEVFAPAVADGMVFAQSSTNFVFAFDQQTGALRWKVDTTAGQLPGGQTSNFPPAYTNGLLVVATGLVDPGGANLENWMLILEARSGRQLWRTSLGRERATQPTIANGMLYLQTESRLFAFGLPPALSGRQQAGGRYWLFVPLTGTRASGSGC
ncbi:MAG: serine/threonine protein kinase [Dehalococcoidia bacterium]|nr:MAG: serine/threonine protein kinase [Dehalococcoidia bacterium]